MPRVRLYDWLRAVMSAYGPTPQRLRHACHVLACFMRGDGTDGCFPSRRAVGEAMGVSYRTAGRDLDELERQGWIRAETVRRQFGKRGRRYFPAIPETISRNGTPQAVPIDTPIGTPSESQFPNGTTASSDNGTKVDVNGTKADRIGTPSVSMKSLSEISNSECAASPSPADADSAARELDSEQLELARDLYGKGFSAAEIARVRRANVRPIPLEGAIAVITHLERAKLQAGR